MQTLVHSSNFQSLGLDQLLTFGEVCSLLRRSRAGLYKMIAADPKFPRPIKQGAARQSRTYFSSAALVAWQASRQEARADD